MTMLLPLSVLVIDDEQIARRRLIRLLRGIEGVEVVGEASDVASAMEAVQQLSPDLMLIDVQMPGGDGFDVIERLGTQSPPAIFVTAFDHHALRAFDIEAVDYVTKPVDPVRLAMALRRAREAIAVRSREEQIGDLLATVETLRRSLRQNQTPSHFFWVKGRGTQQRLGIDTIDYVEAERDYVRLHACGQSHLVSENISAVEARLAPLGFLRIHRSTLVRREAVSQLVQGRYGAWSLRLSDGTELRVGRTYASAVRRALEPTAAS